jgi:hypothetical protein
VRAVARVLAHRLSMYPTPPVSYFAACIGDPRCKPHLGAIGRELFGDLRGDSAPGAPVRGGSLFTRFMLAGFAAYRALEDAGVETLESYPDLQFRIWSHGAIPSKKSREGLKARQQINARLRTRLGIVGVDARTLDQADAEVLAVGAAIAAKEGELLVLADESEGRFLIAMATEHGRRVRALDKACGKKVQRKLGSVTCLDANSGPSSLTSTARW